MRNAYAGLGDLLSGRIPNVYGNYLHLEYLDRRGARETIEEPIRVINERLSRLDPAGEPYQLDAGLVDVVLEDVPAPGGHEFGTGGAKATRGEQIEMGLLQLVMKRLWDTEIGERASRVRTQHAERCQRARRREEDHWDLSRHVHGPVDGRTAQ